MKNRFFLRIDLEDCTTPEEAKAQLDRICEDGKRCQSILSKAPIRAETDKVRACQDAISAAVIDDAENGQRLLTLIEGLLEDDWSETNVYDNLETSLREAKDRRTAETTKA